MPGSFLPLRIIGHDFNLMSSRYQMRNDNESNPLCRYYYYPHMGLRSLRHRKVK